MYIFKNYLFEHLGSLSKSLTTIGLCFLFVLQGLVIGHSQMIPDKDNDTVQDFEDGDIDNDGILNEDEGAISDLFDISSLDGLSAIDMNMMPDPSIITDALNMNNISLSGAILTVDSIFTGGAGEFDEFEINDSQEIGSYGIRLGVQGPVNGPANFVQSNYSFSQPVCNLNARVVDLDTDDAIYVFGYSNGMLVPFSVTNQGGCLVYDGSNTLVNDSNAGIVNGVDCDVNAEPATGNVDDHAFDIQFNGCIDSLVFGIYDTRTTGVQGGGSFTFLISPTPTLSGPDADMDGIPDYQDLDSDNDGIPDAIEACGTMTINLILEECSLDFNGDGTYEIVNGVNTGILTNICSTAPIDTDLDGIPDFLDLDSDGDGCPDATEACTNVNPNVNDTAVSDGYVAPPNGADNCGLVFFDDGVSTSCQTPYSANWVDEDISCLIADITVVQNIQCNMADDGSATVSPSEGNLPYTFLWSTGETTQTATMLVPGVNMVTVTDGCGATEVLDVTITEPTVISTPTATQVDVTCFMESTGSIDLNPTGGTPGYTFMWNDGVMTEDRNGIPAGNYSVLITDANNCQVIREFTIGQPQPIAVDIQIGCEMTFFPGCDADLDYSITGGFGPYTVEITDENGDPVLPNEPGPNWSNLCDGQFDIVITDSANCSTTESFLVCALSCDLMLEQGAITNVSCNGLSDGSVTVIGTSSSQPITYVWEQAGAQIGTGVSQMNLTAGVYKVIATDAIGCLEELTFVVDEPAQLVIGNCIVENVTTFMGSDGSVEIPIIGGTPDYTYNWSNGDMTNPISDLPAGDYMVTVTDMNGCTAVSSCTVQPLLCNNFNATPNSMNISCNGGNDGAIDITVLGAVGASTFVWDPPVSTSSSATGLVAGAYMIEITDEALCSETIMITLTEPTLLNSEIDKEDVSCFGVANGGMDLQVSGGVEPFTFAWSNGVTDEDQENLGPGTYSVTVTDANMCTVSSEVTVTEPTDLVIEFTKVDVLCNGELTGEIDITVSGGTPRNSDPLYDFVWNDGVFTEDRSNLPAGNYSILVTDSNGCTTSREITITEPAPIAIDIQIGCEMTFFPGGDAELTYAVSGGFPEYTVTVTDSLGMIVAPNLPGPNWSNLSDGQYDIMVVDAANCSTTESFLVCSLSCDLELEAGTIVNVSCTDGSDGTATVIGTSSSVPIAYSWEQSGVAFGTGTTQSGLSAGVYKVIAEDAIGCLEELTFVITQPAQLVIDNCESTAVSTVGGSDGQTLITVSGGTEPYTYEWSNGATTNPATNLTSGEYTVTVTDELGCTAEIPCTVQDVACEPFSASINGDNISCNGGNDGAINITVVGSVGNVSYMWDPPISTTASATGLLAGQYQVFVQDEALCGETIQITLTEPTLLSAEIDKEDVICFGEATGNMDLQVSGGVEPFTFAWSNGVTDEDQELVFIGTYSVTVTDANDCTVEASVTVNEPLLLECSTTADVNAICSLANGQATVNVEGGIEPYGYIWDNGEITSTATELTAGLHEVTVSDSNGCSQICTVEVGKTCSPCIELTKASDLDLGANAIADPLDVVTYTYTIVNCGDVTLTDINLLEEAATFSGTGSLPMPSQPSPNSLDPMESITVSSTYEITQADIDAGFIDNQAMVTGNDPDILPTSDLSDTANAVDVNETGGPDDPTNTPIDQNPCIEIIKGSALDIGADGVASPGDIVTYSYEVTNCGNVTLAGVTITEQAAGFSGTGSLPTPSAVVPATLIPGQSAMSSATYAITQADIDAGFIDNQAEAIGADPSNMPVTDLSDTSNPVDVNETGGSDDPTNTPIEPVPCIVLTKGSMLDMGADGVASPGDIVTYSYEVTNCGNVTLAGVTITEQAADFSGTGSLPTPSAVVPATLIPGQSAMSSATYAITQADIDAGFIDNQAEAIGTDPSNMPVTDLSDTSNPVDVNETGGSDDPTNTPIEPEPCIVLTKGSMLDMGADGVASPGDILTYSYEVTNCGNVTLAGVTITEQATGFSGTGSLPTPSAVVPATLIPGQSAMSSATYAITQADIDAGFIDNQAEAIGTDPSNMPVTDLSDTSNPVDVNETGGSDDPTNTPIEPEPCIVLTKGSLLDTGADGVASPGDILTYSYEVTNCGNVTLTSVAITEQAAGFSGTGSLPTPSAVVPATLIPGQSAMSSASYAITQADIDAGFIDNQAEAIGTDPSNMPVTDLSDTSNPVDVNETGGSDDPTNTPIEQEPCIVLTKASSLNLGADNIATPGDILSYTYEVINCGNVTLTEVTITEQAGTFTGTGILPTSSDVVPSTLMPGGSAITSSSYAITQEDIDAGFIDNQAEAIGNDPDNIPVTDLSDTSNAVDVNETGGPDDPTNTPIDPEPCIELIKGSLLDLGADGVATPGDVVTYSYEVTNCGNVTLTGVTISEEPGSFSGTGDLPIPAAVSPSTLLPGDVRNVTATYILTQQDIDNNDLNNQAQAMGSDPSGMPVLDLSDTSNTNDSNETGGPDDPTNTPIGPDPCISLLKASLLDLGADGVATPGDIITYTYDVTNCGNVTLSNVAITEEEVGFSGTGVLPTPSAVIPSTLEPGQMATVTSMYAITQVDIDDGFVNNQALASSVDPDNGPVTDLSDTSNPNDANETGGPDDPTNTPIGINPCIVLTKSSVLDEGADGVANPGDIVTYSYQITNCGNVTLENTVISELPSEFTGTGTLPDPGIVSPSTLIPGQIVDLTAIYILTQADIDAGFIDNQAMVSAVDPENNPVEDLSDTSNPNDVNETGGDDDPTNTPVTPEPCIELIKGSSLNLGADGVVSTGDIVTYTYEALNCGNVTLSDVEIVEQPSTFSGTGSLPIPENLTLTTLSPGQVANATSTYSLTQEDVNNEMLDNQALVSSIDPSGTTVDDLSDTSNPNDINETGGPDDPTNTPFNSERCIVILKASILDLGPDNIPTPGDIITYFYDVTNCGTVTLTDVAIIENQVDFTGTGLLPIPTEAIPTTLQPGEQARASSMYAITQADIDAGEVDNQATVVGTDPDGIGVEDLSDTSNPNDPNETGGSDDPTNTNIRQDPCISLTKGSSLNLGADGVASPGDIITFTYVATNCGNVSLTDVLVEEFETDFSGTGVLPVPGDLVPSGLLPGASATTTSTYAITQIDIDIGGIENQAISSGTDPNGMPVEDFSDTSNPNDINETGGEDDPTFTIIGPDPCISLTKGSSLDFGPDGVASPGDIITYTYEVINCGNVTLTDVTITENDTLFTGTGTLPIPGLVIPSRLEPLETAIVTSTYAITQADIDEGEVDNQAITSGLDPEGQPIEDLSDTVNPNDPNETGGEDDPTNTSIGPDPCISLTKASSLDMGADGVVTPGDIITFTYVALNCGNVSLDNVEIIEDPMTFTGSGALPIPTAVMPSSLLPGESGTASATYAVTQADIDSGLIENQAVATAMDPEGNTVEDTSDTSNPNDPNDTGGDDDPTSTLLEAEPCISLTKGSALDMGADAIATPGDLITYTYEVINCGNVTLTAVEIVEDDATFTGTGPLPIPPAVIPSTLEPGQMVTVESTYAITQADIDVGGIDNQAITSAADPKGNVVEDVSDTSNPNDSNETGGDDDPTNTVIQEAPCVELEKGSFLDLGNDGVASVGDVIKYTYLVRNCGNVTLSNIVISEIDALFTGTNGLPVPSNSMPDILSPGQEALAEADYIITQADIDAGEVINQALVVGDTPSGTSVEDESDTANPNDPAETGGDDDETTTIIGGTPCLDLLKGSFLDLGPDQLTTVGDVITYTYEITNCGNVTISNINLSESATIFSGSGGLPVPDDLVLTTLLPNESTMTSATYLITQADIDAGEIVNQAIVVGQSPDGVDVQDVSDTSNPNDPRDTGGSDDPTTTELGENPCIELLKGSSFDQGPGGLSSVGDVITYSYTIINCGNVTLSNIVLTENNVSFTGTGIIPDIGPLSTTTLAPGEQITSSSTYLITLQDIIAGFVNNQAVTSAMDPSGEMVSDLSDTTNPNDANETGGPDDPTNTPIDQPGTVSGTTYEDRDGDGDEDVPLPFVEVTIVDSEDNEQTTISDENGNYTFENVSIGEYTITAEDPTGFNSVGDSDGTNDNTVMGNVQPGEVSDNNDFIDEEPADISGTVTDDEDNDSAGETPLEGVIITLIDRDGDTFTTVTDENGDYMFEDIDPGPYTVIETDLDDYVSISDIDGGDPNVIEDVLISGDDSIENNFIDGICDELVCNGDLQISLNQDCKLELTADMVLEYPSVGIYTIELFDSNNEYLRDSFLLAEDAGEIIKYKISCLDNSCWGNIIVEANNIPEFDVPCSVNADGSIPDDCTFWCGDGDIIPDILVSTEDVVRTFGECGPDLLGEIKVEENILGDLCDTQGQVIELVYTGKVILHGQIRVIDILTQRYTIMKLDISGSEDEFNMNFGFPDDVILDCKSSTLPEDILDLTGEPTDAYPYYVDMHRLVDHKIRVIDSIELIVAEVERDTMIKELIGGDSLWVLKTVVDKITELVPDTSYIDNPDGPINPKVPIKERVCNLLAGYSDVIFDACGDGRKIIRSWEMVDWCESDLTRTYNQTIEVKDTEKPKIYNLINGKRVETDMLDDVIVGLEPWSCSASIKLPQLLVSDNCDVNPVIEWTSNEGMYSSGYMRDLWLSEEPITIFGTVTDQCGNQSTVSFKAFVMDDVAPVASCDIALSISLAGNTSGYGGARLYAKDIDEGSHDSGCGKIKLTAVRMEDWANPVRDCNQQVIGFEPQSCSPLTSEIDGGEVIAKEGCAYNEENIVSITHAGEYVQFCCEDAGKIIPVILFVEDEYGNVSQCVVNVEVLDGGRVQILCPDVVITCAEEGLMRTPPLVGGVCESEAQYEVELISEIKSNNACSGGQSIREWFIDTNASGDYTIGEPYCRQFIRIEISAPFDPFTIKWPKHFDGKQVTGINLECDDDADVDQVPHQVTMGDAFLCTPGELSDEPVWCDTECGLIGYTVETDTIRAGGTVQKLIRRWSVVDWCVYNANADNDSTTDQFIAVEDWAQGDCAVCPDHGPVTDNVYFKYTDVELDGYYTYDQVIVIEDNEAPEITAPDEFKVITSEGAQTKDDQSTCTGNSLLMASADDYCAGNSANNEGLQWTVTITKNGQVVSTEQQRGSEITINTLDGSPGDVHVITWRVDDGKGNQSTETTTVIFGDNVSPTPLCIANVTTVFLDTDGSSTIHGSQFDFGSFDNCTNADDLIFSLVPKGTAAIEPGGRGFDSQLAITFDCNELGHFTSLDVWVWDASGNGDKCTVGLTFTDPEDCPEVIGSSAQIAGSIQSIFGEMMHDVDLTISSALSEYPKQTRTDDGGEYLFDNNPLDHNYRVEASLPDEASNGVTTIDALLIQRHVMGLEDLDSPHKIIAADVTNDATVKASDIIEIRRLILGVTDEFSNNDSWTFVSAEQSFIDESNPFPYTDMLDVIDLKVDQMEENFLGIKTGDVTGDAVLNGLSPASTREDLMLTLRAEDTFLKKGELIKLPIRTTQFEELAGFQFTLEHQGLEFIDLEAKGLKIDQSHLAEHDEMLTFSWSQADVEQAHDDLLFYLSFRANQDVTLSNRLVLSSKITKSEAYLRKTFDLMSVSLSFENVELLTDQAVLYQNEPNPFTDQTDITFYLPRAESVVLSVHDISGMRVKSIVHSGVKGDNKLTLRESDFKASGVYYYRLESSSYTLTKKLILVD